MGREQVANLVKQRGRLSTFDNATIAVDHCDVADGMSVKRKSHGRYSVRWRSGLIVDLEGLNVAQRET